MRTFLVVLAAGMILTGAGCQKQEETPESQKADQTQKTTEAQSENTGPFAEAIQLAKDKGCFSCHDVSAKRVGPAYKEVAKRYADEEGAVDILVKSITEGSMGKWGTIPMNKQTGVTKDQAKLLAEWILSLK